MQNRGTRWSQERRIGNDVDLSFDNTSSQTVETLANVVLSGNYLAVSFFREWTDGNNRGHFELGDFNAVFDFMSRMVVGYQRGDNDAQGSVIMAAAGPFSGFVGRKVCFGIIWDGLNNDVYLYVNGRLVDAVFAVPNGINITQSSVLKIGERLGSYMQGEISDLVVLNPDNIADCAEMVEFHAKNKSVPGSVHDGVLAHFPLNQDAYFKADATFVAEHGLFVVGDRVAFDVVEQYNYAKVSPATANHGKLLNFTDDLVGSNDTPHKKTAPKGFYTNRVVKDIGVQGENTMQIRVENPTWLPSGGSISAFVEVLVMEDWLLDASNSSTYIFSRGDFPAGNIRIDPRGVSYKDNITNPEYLLTAEYLVPKGSIFRCGFTYNSGTNEIVFGRAVLGKPGFEKQSFAGIAWTAGVTVAVVGGLHKSSSFSGLAVLEAIVHDGVLDETLDLDAWLEFEDDISTTPELRARFTGKYDTGSDEYIVDIGGSGRRFQFPQSGATGLTAWDNSKLIKGGEFWKDTKSLFPPANKAWKGIYDFDYIRLPLQPFKDVANQSFTFMVRTWVDRAAYPAGTNAIFRTVGGTGGNMWIYYNNATPGLRFGSIGVNAVRTANVDHPLKEWVTFFFTKEGNAFDSNGGTFDCPIKLPYSGKEILGSNAAIGGAPVVDWSTLTEVRGYNDSGYCAGLGLWDRVLSKKEQDELGNKTFFANPTIKQQEGLKGFWLMNEVVDNGGTPEFKDYSPNGENAWVVGQTVAEAESALVDIDSLR